MTDLEKQAKTSVEHVLVDFKQILKAKGIKQKELAKQLNVSVTTLWRIFNHKTPMSLELFIKMCIVLELNVKHCSCDFGVIVCPGCDGEKVSEFSKCAGCEGIGVRTCGKCGVLNNAL